MASEEVTQRTMEIVRDFVAWTPETGRCPISINDQHWFGKLCALAARCAELEFSPSPPSPADREEIRDAEHR